MSTEAQFISRYDRRVRLVHEIVKEHSTVDDETAAAIAVQVLHALDTVPEKVR